MGKEVKTEKHERRSIKKNRGREEKKDRKAGFKSSCLDGHTRRSHQNGMVDNIDARLNHISDISPIQGLSNLTQLYFERNLIQNIKPISILDNLEAISFGANEIKDIKPIAKLKKLKSIGFTTNRIFDISATFIKMLRKHQTTTHKEIINRSVIATGG